MVRRSRLPNNFEASHDSADDLPDLPSGPRTENNYDDVRRERIINGIRKQISLMVSLEDWKLIQLHAAETNQSITAVVREWIAPEVRKLRQ